MKRLLLVIPTALSFHLLPAQSLKITDIWNNIIPNGSIIDVWCDVNASAPYVDFNVINISGSSKYFSAKRDSVSWVDSTSNLFCWYACYPPAVDTSRAVPLAPQGSNFLTSHYYPNGHLGTTTIYYAIWDSLNPADSAWITVRWNATPAGVNSGPAPVPGISGIYPNPASNLATVSCQVNGTDNAMVSIHTLTGEEVKRISMNANEREVTFSVNDLEPGIYFCRFFTGEKILATRKLTVIR